MSDIGPGCLLDGLMNWLIPKTPWQLFVVLVVLALALVLLAFFLQSQ